VESGRVRERSVALRAEDHAPPSHSPRPRLASCSAGILPAMDNARRLALWGRLEACATRAARGPTDPRMAERTDIRGAT
jgi:hypothetical protein